jgi:hypothetical protein
MIWCNYGGYHRVPADAWAQFDLDNADRPAQCVETARLRSAALANDHPLGAELLALRLFDRAPSSSSAIAKQNSTSDILNSLRRLVWGQK